MVAPRGKMMGIAPANAGAQPILRPQAPGEAHEVPLVSLDALSVPAGRFQGALSLRLGRSAGGRALRSGQGASGLQRLSRPARVRRAGRLRRHLRERASPERLWPDAVAQPDGGGAGAAHVAGQARRARQWHGRRPGS